MYFDLLDLDDSVFEIHEEILTDESQLFRLDSHFEKVLRSNPTARTDGVFRVRLSEDLRRKDTNWEDFWRENLSDTAGKDVTVQFLLAGDDPNTSFVMETASRKLPRNRASFFKSLQSAEAFKNSTPSCCSEILRKDGPKQAVKHFYEALASKCIVIPKCSKPAVQDTTLGKKYFSERQKIMQGNDPVTVCALIEQSMKSKPYAVTNNQGQHSSKCDLCQCHQCCLHRLFEEVELNPQDLKADGDGANCSLYLTDVAEECGKYLYVTTNFALSHLCHANMLTDLESYYEGVSFPYVYIGGLHSYFALHIEDMSLPSFNFLHMGHPKLWIVVSPAEITKLSLLLSHYGLNNMHRVCIFKLAHKNSIIFPQFLVHHKINFKIIIQEPGDFILLAPNAAHTGGNMGINLSEACNLGTVDWLPYGSVASTENCNCLENKVHMDITPLLEMHRKDLLNFHERGSMATDYNDDLFKRCIIGIGPSPSCNLGLLPPPLEQTTKRQSASKSRKRERISCPVEDCFTSYAHPVKKQTLLTHLEQEHSRICKKRKILEAVDKLCGTASADNITKAKKK